MNRERLTRVRRGTYKVRNLSNVNLNIFYGLLSCAVRTVPYSHISPFIIHNLKLFIATNHFIIRLDLDIRRNLIFNNLLHCIYIFISKYVSQMY